jgi:basic membrane protein A
MAALLVACGGQPAPEDGPDEEPETSTETGSDEGEGGPFRVAVVMPSTVNDLAFSQSMYDALVAIQEERGEENFEIVYSENMFVVDDAAAALRDYATQGFDLVIAHGSQYGSSLVEIAPDFPDTSFAWGTTVDTFEEQGINNVFAYTVLSNEGAYVEGVVAAMLTETGTLGVVGPIPAGDALLTVEGFAVGARAQDPDIEVLITNTGSFSDVSLAAEAAQTHIDAGADILTGTGQMVVGAVGVVDERDALWFGNQADQTSLAPDNVIGNQIYDLTVILEPMIEEIESGTLGGEVYYLTLENGGLIIEFNPEFDLPDEVRQKAEETIQGIIDGEIDASIDQSGVTPPDDGEGADEEGGEGDSGEESDAGSSASTAGPFRVAAVLPGTANDYGISHGVIDALAEIQEEMGEENFEYAISESMFVVDDAAAAIRDYASQDYDMVIAASSAFGSSVEEIAPDFPEVSFVWGTDPQTFGLDNVYAFAVNADQGAYVGGVMSALMSDTIAFVGPIDVGSISRSVDGFTAGAQAANPDVQVLESFTGSFSDVAAATEAARTMIDAGATVVAGQTEMGVGVAGAAEQADDVAFFGNDADFAPFAPESTFASQVFNYGVALRQMIDQVQQGQLGGEVIVLSLDNDGIYIAFNEEYPLSDEVRQAGEEAIQGIIDGTVDTGLEPLQ